MIPQPYQLSVSGWFLTTHSKFQTSHIEDKHADLSLLNGEECLSNYCEKWHPSSAPSRRIKLPFLSLCPLFPFSSVPPAKWAFEPTICHMGVCFLSIIEYDQFIQAMRKSNTYSFSSRTSPRTILKSSRNGCVSVAYVNKLRAYVNKFQDYREAELLTILTEHEKHSVQCRSCKMKFLVLQSPDLLLKVIVNYRSPAYQTVFS